MIPLSSAGVRRGSQCKPTSSASWNYSYMIRRAS
jgi:hypothetical protein